jgi:hypothetical protein
MRLLTLVVSLTALVAVVAACGGKSEGAGDPPCTSPPPPPIVTAASVVRLDALNLGDVDANGVLSRDAWMNVGFNLDGRCSKRDVPRSFACKRSSGADIPKGEDGPNGLDNSFGKNLIRFLVGLYPNPSEVHTGFSYLETQANGRGALYLGTKDGVSWVVPLVDVRLTLPRADGSVTLAAIAPRDALARNVEDRANVFGLCGSSAVDTVVQTIRQASDMLLAGPPDPDVECDAISVALTFVPTPVPAAPTVGPDCNSLPRDAGVDASGD